MGKNFKHRNFGMKPENLSASRKKRMSPDKKRRDVAEISRSRSHNRPAPGFYPDMVRLQLPPAPPTFADAREQEIFENATAFKCPCSNSGALQNVHQTMQTAKIPIDG